MCNTDKKSTPHHQQQQGDAALTHAGTPVISNRAAQKQPPPIPLFSSTETPVIVRPSTPPGRQSDLARLRTIGNDDFVPLAIALEWAVRSLTLSCSPLARSLWRSTTTRQRSKQRQRKHHTARRPVGIPNHGQTCFLNATLQALAACGTCITDYVEDMAPYSRTAALLRTVLYDLRHHEGVVDPRPLLAVTQLTRHQQHDAQECLGAILSAIAEEIDWNAYALEQTKTEDEIVFPRIRKGRGKEQEELQETHDEQVNQTSGDDPEVKQNLSGSSCSESTSSNVEAFKKTPLGERLDATNVEVYQDEKKQEEFTLNGGQSKELRQEQRPTTFSSSSFNRMAIPTSSQQAISFSHLMATPAPIQPPATPRPWQYSSTTPTPLSGWMGSRITCQTCQTTKPVSHQPFLNLPVAPTARSISSCLAQAVASDALENVACDACTAAEQDVIRHAIAACARKNSPIEHLQAELDSTSFRGPATQDLRLARLPAVLSIHVQRRSLDPITQQSHKTATVVTIEPILDVAPFLSTTVSSSTVRTPIRYRLVAVMVHCGGQADAGHYVCYRRHGGRWWWISDAVVQPCEWSTVARCQAYMLFYTKIIE